MRACVRACVRASVPALPAQLGHCWRLRSVRRRSGKGGVNHRFRLRVGVQRCLTAHTALERAVSSRAAAPSASDYKEAGPEQHRDERHLRDDEVKQAADPQSGDQWILGVPNAHRVAEVGAGDLEQLRGMPRPFVRWFVRSFVHWLVGSFVHWLVRSFVCLGKNRARKVSENGCHRRRCSKSKRWGDQATQQHTRWQMQSLPTCRRNSGRPTTPHHHHHHHHTPLHNITQYNATQPTKSTRSLAAVEPSAKRSQLTKSIWLAESTLVSTNCIWTPRQRSYR